MFAAFPKPLVIAVAAFALLTFMITASGMTLVGIGSAFGVVGGMVALYVLRPRTQR